MCCCISRTPPHSGPPLPNRCSLQTQPGSTSSPASLLSTGFSHQPLTHVLRVLMQIYKQQQQYHHFPLMHPDFREIKIWKKKILALELMNCGVVTKNTRRARYELLRASGAWRDCEQVEGKVFKSEHLSNDRTLLRSKALSLLKGGSVSLALERERAQGVTHTPLHYTYVCLCLD